MASKEEKMSEREQLNQAHYHQALRFAENFAKQEKEEFLQETHARNAFEQSHILQKNTQNTPLAKKGIGLLALVLAGCAVFYWQTNRLQTVNAGSQAFSEFQQQQSEIDSTTRNERYILNLQNKLRANPNDGDLWFELAQAYALDNDFESALICFKNAEKVLGQTAAILGGKATVEYYRAKHKITPTVQKLIDDALEKDSNESASRLLLASDAFLRNDFQQAIEQWEIVLNSEHQAINRRELIKSINMAKQRLAAE